MTPALLRSSTKLTEHFTWGEFRDRDGKLPPRSYYPAALKLCRLYLEPLRLALGPVHITSSYRTPEQNRAVGGAPASRHVAGTESGVAAADLYVARAAPRQVYEYLEQLSPGGLGLYATHVHVDTRRGRARW